MFYITHALVNCNLAYFSSAGSPCLMCYDLYSPFEFFIFFVITEHFEKPILDELCFSFNAIKLSFF